MADNDNNRDRALTNAGSGNRLHLETSPYLLQHRDNPVHWRPWGPEAFEAAEARGVPVLLSIGYSSCHWCHVMAHESFSDAGIARRMNELFVPVKVDREERPDVDEIYMAFVQASTGAGGWPLTVFLAPDRTPVFGGTYFPPEDRWGRPGFPRVLEGVAEAWREPSRRGLLLDGGRRMLDRLRQAAALPGQVADPGALITGEIIGRGVRALLRSHDREHGGFGAAPKFPPARQLTLLLERYAAAPDGPDAAEALAAARRTLRRMAAGGLMDQLGGGFHRYSTDAEWLVPHFEKMLYDNALLVPVYLTASRLSGAPDERAADADTARRTLDWIRRDLGRPGGGFYSALDADSEGEEGRYYVWSQAEIESVLGEDAPLFAAAFDARSEGNWEGKTVLRRVASEAGLGDRFGLATESVAARLDAARARLLEARAARVRPALDDKILLSWNALTISALARAHRVLGAREYLVEAQRTGRFLLDALRVEGRYRAVWCRGRAGVAAMLDDHAFWLAATLDLFESDHDEAWLGVAEETAEILLRRFAAPGGGFWSTADDHEPLPVRTRSGHDGALPAGNAIAADSLLRLHALTGNPACREAARGVIAAFLPLAAEAPTGWSTLLAAVGRYLAEPRQVVVVGRRASEAAEAALTELWRIAPPGSVILFADREGPGSTRLPALAAARAAPGDGLAFLPCRGGVCGAPLDSAASAAQWLATAP